jgi:arylsulfatase A-like enzyme/Tfp pilus assembly protein PilF
LAGAAAVVHRARRATRPPAADTAGALPGGVRTTAYPPFEGPRFTRANVVVITIDTLRRDHLAPYGAAFETAAASRLAHEGVVFEHAASQVPLTLPSHASIFTGLYPTRHGVRDNGGFVLDKDATTLAERLSSRGYRTAGFVSSYVLHSRWGIGQGYETYDDLFDFAGLEHRPLTDVERPGRQVVDAALEWLRQPRPAGQPFYLWLHLYDPHEPYDPPDGFRRRAPTPYAAEVMYADAQVARLLDALDALGLRRNTLILYLSDHGESLGEHGEPTHGIFLYGASLDVPLIIAPPAGRLLGSPPLALAGRRVRGLARLVDVTPTVLDLLGLPPVSDLDGVSLLPMVAQENAAPTGPLPDEPADAVTGPASYAETYYPRFHYNWSELSAVETARWKFVHAPRPELYDLVNDPNELHDVSAAHPRVAATLAKHLDSLLAQHDAAVPTPAALDSEALARLKSLGYVSGRESAAARHVGPRLDPKDGLPFLKQLVEAQAERDAGRLEAALKRLQSLAQRDPDNPAVFVALASVYDRRQDWDGALTASKRALALDPENVVTTLDVALAYRSAGRADEAAVGFQRVLTLDAGNIKALLNLAEIHQERGDMDKAFDLYQRAVGVAPRSTAALAGLGSAAIALNRLDAAEDALKRAVALGGVQPDLHFNLGVMAEQRGQPAAAAREYRAEIAAHPASLRAWVNLGLLERQAGRIDAALSAFEHAAAASTDTLEGPYLLAETLLALGRRQQAEKWATEALRRSPSDPRAQQLLRRIRD